MQPRVVLLLGWLGCQRRNLRRYEAFYRSLGLDVVLHVASPSFVVRAALGLPNPLELKSINELKGSTLTVHAFSNGGAFVYEQLIRLGFHVVSVVLDSAPSLRLDNLPKALEYCTDEERRQVEADIPELREWESPRVQDMIRDREDEYRSFWMRHQPGIPLLFLFSETDALAPTDGIRAIVRARANVNQKCWDDSPHCAHMLHHEKDYQDAIRHFLLGRTSGLSKL